MSQLVNNTLSAWSLIEAMNPAVINDPRGKLGKDKFLNNVSHATYQDDRNYESIWQEQKFFINKKTKNERRFKYLRSVFRMYKLDESIKDIFNDKSEIYNTSRTLCYSYHFEIDDRGKYIDDSLYVPMIMSALKSVEKDFNADINQLYQDAFEKFETNFNEIFADEIIDNDKVKELDIVYRDYFYQFDFDSTDGHFENYIEIEHINPEFQLSEMNSFYIDDIEKAKSNINKTLTKYIEGINDSERIIVDENKEYLEGVLTPDQYPDGRWPSLIEHKLSLMQQAAVNQITGNSQVISSVNGPPGTGKTTLLKDIFAHYVVERAKNIAEFNKPQEAFKPKKMHDTEKYPTNFLDPSLTNFKMVVTSSNNGAVENISKDLPKFSEVIRGESDHGEFPHYEEKYSASAEDLTDFQGIASNLIEESAWGLFSGVFGKKKNIDTVIAELLGDYNGKDMTFNKLLIKLEKEKDITREWNKVKGEFNAELKAVKDEKKKLNDTLQLYRKVELNSVEAAELEKQLQMINTQKVEATKRKTDLDYYIGDTDIQIQQRSEVINNLRSKRGIIEKIIVKFKGETEEVVSAQNNFNTLVNEKDKMSSERKDIVNDIREYESSSEKVIQKTKKFIDDKKKLNDYIANHDGLTIPNQDFWNEENYDKRQESVLWVSDKLQYHRGQLFLKAMVLHKVLLIANAKKVQSVLFDFKRRNEFLESAPDKVKNSWNLIHLIFPVISTTFASFGRMYKTMPKDFIDYLFVDEAGQAIPQAAAGAMYRSKHAIVVGDPIQIEPVVTLNNNLIERIRKVYDVPERLLSVESSVQSLADNANKFGFYKNDGDHRQWIGTPLWVHRRCLNPMFSIANEIAYENKMVLPSYIKKNEEKGKTGITKWFDASGKAVNKQYVKEHGELILNLVIEDWEKSLENNNGEPDVYVISPFSEVKDRIKILLKSKLKDVFLHNNDINFEKWVDISVGTVHTFQGKEADKVYFVAGTDDTQNGAAQWSCSKPNLLNVAVTRAKKEFYIIGDNERLSQMQYYNVIDRLGQK